MSKPFVAMLWLAPWLALSLAGCNCGTTPTEVLVETNLPPTPEVVEPEALPEAPVEEPPLPILALDTHVDTTLRMIDEGDDISESVVGGHLDLPRMRAGGLSGAFFSVWVNPRRYGGERAYQRALAMTEAIHKLANDHPTEARLCRTSEEVRSAHADGVIALLIGVEGGHALGTDDPAVAIQRLRDLFDLGARYMTITWSTDNPLGHSSTGDSPSGGLTSLGRRVVREMNRLGMIIDVSHVSDQTFSDIMDLTERPVLASHSSVRALSNHARNMTDAMIRRVGEGGGAVCINYFAQYIDVDYRNRLRRVRAQNRREFREAEAGAERYTDRGPIARELALRLSPTIDPPTIVTLADHFSHVIEIAGPESVCLGSDFDGVSELPVGLDDVSDLPALEAELRAREVDPRAIFGENVLRVLSAQSQ